MDKALFNNVAHIGMIRYLLCEKKAQEAFRKMTGYNISLIASGSELDRLINKTTGFEKEIFYRFVVWATENYWNTPEESQDIEIYVAAKEYLNKNNKRMVN